MLVMELGIDKAVIAFPFNYKQWLLYGDAFHIGLAVLESNFILHQAARSAILIVSKELQSEKAPAIMCVTELGMVMDISEDNEKPLPEIPIVPSLTIMDDGLLVHLYA